MRLAAWVLCLTSLGCALTPVGPLDFQVSVGAGQTIEVPSASIRLGFRSVVGDSRCPADALCIQAGDAIVRIEVQSAIGPWVTYDLHTGNTQPIHHDNVTIALVELTPYPLSSRPIPPSEYRATFRVRR